MSLFPQTQPERAAFRDGVRDLLPSATGTFAWALVTGVAMVKSGLSLWQCLGMTLFVYAGSAQLAALPLIAAAAPVWVIVVTALVINLRFVTYSVAMRHELREFSVGRRVALGYITGDIGFAVFMSKLRREPNLAHKDWYFLGGSMCNWVAWQSASLIGIFAGASIPTEWGLGLDRTLGAS